MVDPLHQFEIHRLIPLSLFGYDVSFTNASLSMLISALLIVLVLHLATGYKHHLIPGRFQVAVESLFSLVAQMLKTHVGPNGLVYFPYVFCLFLFILMGNLLGLLPYSFTFTSHIIVTLCLALFVFFSSIILGFAKHGLHFLKLFLPDGIPLYVAPLLVPVEIISFLSRPISLAVRLFANMVAGHIMLKIFAGFGVLLVASNLLPLALAPLLVNAAMTGFELLVAILQAYVFTILTCIYLNDAINLH
jgi:F-type H+-transporting ATPase subunit a